MGGVDHRDKIAHALPGEESELFLSAEERPFLSPEAAPDRSAPTSHLLPPLAAFLVGAFAHLPVLGSYWNQDDWGLLGRAAGLLQGAEFPARLASQVLYWQLLYPICGLGPDPYAFTRLLLHGASAAVVARLAARGGFGGPAQMVAGLLFAATPLVFTPLYWASGVQELLAVFCALAALERWLAGGRPNLLAACLLAVLAMLSKENALGLPLLLAAMLWRGRVTGRVGRGAAWLAIVFLVVIAAGESVLVLRHFDTGTGQAYAFGPWYRSAANLAMYGWWLLTPGPVFAARFSTWMGLTGWALWVLWGTWVVWKWRHGDYWPAACCLGAVLALLPALPLDTHSYPYLALLSGAAGALTIASVLPRHWTLRPLLLVLLVFLAAAWAWGGTTYRLKLRDQEGLPADPLVRRTAVAYEAIRTLQALPATAKAGPMRHVILLQPPLARPDAELAARLGKHWVAGTLLYNALDGAHGPRLMMPDSISVKWANNLDGAPLDAFVLVDAETHLLPWGRTPQALLYLGLTEVAAGQFGRARDHLLRAALVSDETIPFFYDPDLMLAPATAVQARAAAFREFLGAGSGGEVANHTVSALVDLFDSLLRVCARDAGD